MSALVDALLAEFDEDALAELARRLAPYLPAAVEAPADDLLTTSEAARRASVHIETVRRAIRAGHLAVAGQVGRNARLAPADVDAWVAAGRVSATPRPRASRPRGTRRRGPLEDAIAAAGSTRSQR